MEDTPLPCCSVCGGTGVEDPTEVTLDLTKIPATVAQRWRRQMENRPQVLRALDRFLGCNESKRLMSNPNLNEVTDACFSALVEADSRAKELLRHTSQDRADLSMGVLEVLFQVAAELVHYLSNRGYPMDDVTIARLVMRAQQKDKDDPKEDISRTPGF